MSFPARGSHLVITAAHWQLARVLSLISKNETCIFFFCRQRRYFQANQDCGSRKLWGLRKLEFIMKYMKCLNRAIYKYAVEVLLALRNSLFTLPCNAPTGWISKLYT